MHDENFQGPDGAMARINGAWICRPNGDAPGRPATHGERVLERCEHLIWPEKGS
jgi:hypothetical protein